MYTYILFKTSFATDINMYLFYFYICEKMETNIHLDDGGCVFGPEVAGWAQRE